LIIIWSALGVTHYAIRIPGAAAALVLLLAFWAIDCPWSLDSDGLAWEEFYVALLCLPLFFIAIQAPLWVPRTLAGWRIERPQLSQATRQRSPVTLRHIMLATTVVAVSLALARLAHINNRPSAVVVTVIASLVLGVLNLLFTLLHVRLLLSSRRLWLGLRGMLLSPIVICTIIGGCFMGSVAAEEWLVVMPVFMTSWTISIAAVLFCVRAMGYRLQRGRQKRRTGDTDSQGGLP
jgi:hypothetical protein